MAFLSIWLDTAYDSIIAAALKSDIIATHLSLCNIDPYLITFRHAEKCVDYIVRLPNGENRVVLIISNQAPVLSFTITELVQLPQIDSVYILCSNEMKPAEIFEISVKIVGIYTDLEMLCHQLRQIPDIGRGRRREGFLHDDFSVNSFLPCADDLSTPIHDPNASISQLLSIDSTTTKRQEAEFMYAQFLRDILIDIKSTLDEMVAFFRQKYAGNEAELIYVDEFEAYYDAINAIFWYTRDIFLYRILNEALREQDIDTLYSIRHFIKDLHLEMKKLHASQQQTTSVATPSILETVYRGQRMINENFDKKLRYNTGGFFSVTSFFSTTQNENLATVYAGDLGKSNGTATEQSVLFQIDIDRSINKFPYADISNQSAFDEAESETLFTMGAVFRILSMNFDSDQGFWNVHLKLTGEEDKELRTLSDYNIDDYVYSDPPLSSLGKLMLRMGNYDKAEQYYLLALQDSTITTNLIAFSSVHNNLGVVYGELELTEKAIEHYEKSLEIDLKHLPITDLSFAETYSNLGSAYSIQAEYEKALSYYEKALEIFLTSPKLNIRSIATCYNNIGLLYNEQQRYLEALDMFKKSLDIRSKHLPANHPDISESYNNISRIYDSLDNYEKAVDYLNKALQNDMNCLPPNHPDFGTTYNNLAKSLYKQGKVQEALHYMEKAHENLCTNFPSDHIRVISTGTWIANVDREIAEGKQVETDH